MCRGEAISSSNITQRPDPDGAAMCHSHTRSGQKPQLSEQLLSTTCPLTADAFSDSPPGLIELHHHSVSCKTLLIQQHFPHPHPAQAALSIMFIHKCLPHE
ncbi:hypothetical protein Q5P01_016344 [Channa striata]|uniref:Uncharacterized protein n=1 Tax=Channa striata TaxID=64152 RepID=A0AA88MDY0_CHASR|nr:hypothetical protein Q5P01_016344 [Channa striata]